MTVTSKTHKFEERQRNILLIISPPGIAMPPAGLCFTDITIFFKMSPLSFENGWTDRYANCYVNTANKNITTAKNLVNFGPVTPEIL